LLTWERSYGTFKDKEELPDYRYFENKTQGTKNSFKNKKNTQNKLE